MSLRRFFMTTINRDVVLSLLAVDTLSPMSVPNGTAFGSLGLPATIDVDLNNGTTEPLSVVWDSGPYDGDVADVYNLTGTITLPANRINPLGLIAEIEVTVEAALDAPVNTVDPAITPTPAELGDLLTVTDGTWTGTGPITYAYQWRRNGVNISGATANTHTVVADDVGQLIDARVTATNANGSTASLSNAVPIDAIVMVIDSTVEAFDKEEFHFQDRVPNGKYEQGLIVDPTTGRILMSAAHPWSNQFYSLGLLHYYDPNDGFAPAAITTTERQSEIDNHLTTSVHIHGDYVYIFQEDAHKQAMDIFRSPKDLSDFTKFDSAGNYARCSIYDVDATTFYLLLQHNELVHDGDPLVYVPVDTTTGMGSPVLLMTLESAGKRWYPMKPGGVEEDDDGYAHVVMVSSTSGGTEEYFHVKTPTGADFMDEFYDPEGNLLFTISIDGPQEAGILRDNNCRVYGEYAGPNAADFTTCVTEDGSLYSVAHQIFDFEITWVSSRTFDTLDVTRSTGRTPFTKFNSRYWLSKTNNNTNHQPPSDASTENTWWIEIDPEDYYGYGNLYFIKRVAGAYVKTAIDIGINPIGIRKYPDGRCVEWIARMYGLFYIAIRVWDGTHGKFYLFSSPDGVSWTDQGDIFPGVNEDIHRCKTVDNYPQLDIDKNFAFYGCKVNYIDATPGNAQVGDVYAVRAAFDTIKTEVPSTPPAAYTEMSDTPWKFLLESDNLTEAGGLISAIADGSGNGRTPTINGNIYYQDGSIKTLGSAYLSFSSFADFQGDDRFTLMGVFKKIGNSYILAAGDTSDQNKFMCLRVMSDGSIGWQVRTTAGNTDDVESWANILGDEYFIATFVNTGYNFRIRINGIETNLRYFDDPISNIGKWFDLQTYNNLTIGAVVTTAATTTPIDFKVIAYHDDVKTLEQIQKAEELLLSKYSIVKGDFGTATTYEPECEITFARMTVDPPTTTEKEYYDGLIKIIKTDNNLTLGQNNLGRIMDTLYIDGAHDSQAALLNWARPFFDKTAVNSPAFTQWWGYKSNGTTSYLNWNFNPSIHSRFPSNNLMIGGYCLENPTRGNKAIIGLSVGSNFNARLFPRNSSDNASLIVTAGTALTIGSVTDMREMYFARRESTTRYAKRGAAAETSGVTAATAFSNANVYELAENDDGTAAFFLDGLVGFTFWGSPTINMDALRTAVRNYLVARGVTGI